MKKMKQTMLLFAVLIIGCSDDTSIENLNPESEEGLKSERLIKDIEYDGDERGSHFFYESDLLSKSSTLNSANYELYEYNTKGKIINVTQYYDSREAPDNTLGLDFNNPKNFNDTEYVTIYNWVNDYSIKIRGTQYNFDENGLVHSVEQSGFQSESFNIYYKDNQIDKVIYGSGNVYTFECMSSN